ncbi:MAG TPA: NAD-dependent epimerase/dehydratase family protein, partial [Candidatus Limnocylindrales bacterium]
MTRIVVTGGAGFVGRAVVRRLLDRGDTAVAVVRDPHKAGDLAALGAELAQDDLADIERLTRLLDGADGAIHAAGSYRVGIPKADRPAMWDANVGTTTRFLDA